MVDFLGKLLPIHGYYVSIKTDLRQNYALSLSHLYQPLVGMQAMMLYHTLLNESELYQEGRPQTHHTLMNYLNSPLDTIYEARTKLEAIGLLKTFMIDQDSQKTFHYELQSPFSPREFFNDPMLSELLYHHLGDRLYHKLRENLLARPERSHEEREITAQFSEVFTTVQPSLSAEAEAAPTLVPPQGGKEEEFPYIRLALQQQAIPAEKVLTPKNKRLMTDMMQLYHLTEIDIEKCVLWALSEENTLDVNEFKAACHDIFRTERNALIQLRTKEKAKEVARAEPSLSPSPQEGKTGENQREQLCDLLETISIRQLLEGYTEGEASENDLKMIGEVMETHQLKPGVMNVLIHYVLTQSNRRLTRGYVEKIASHWARLPLNSARDAMDFVQEEIEKVRQRKQKQQQPRRQGQKEVLPKWFKEQREERQQTATAQKPSLDKDEVLALFHKHSRENNKKQG